MENTRIIIVCNEEYSLSSSSDILAPFPCKIQMKAGCVSMRLMYYVECYKNICTSGNKYIQVMQFSLVMNCI